jgi:hypothetical protein
MILIIDSMYYSTINLEINELIKTGEYNEFTKATNKPLKGFDLFVYFVNSLYLFIVLKAHIWTIKLYWHFY